MALLHESLGRELDEWAAAGTKARLWWRDDDAVSDTPQLRRLLELAAHSDAVVALAVIPEGAQESLARLAERAPCCIWQHGLIHHDHGQGEFGEGRPLDLLKHEALRGQRWLDRLFTPAGWQRVFVPPFHAISMPFKRAVAGLGYVGLSAGDPLVPPVEGLPEQNAAFDLTDWSDGSFYGADAVCTMLVRELAMRRGGELAQASPIGVLTHHLALAEEAWAFLAELVGFLDRHPAVEFIAPDTLFDALLASRSPSAPVARSTEDASEAVTVVVTSCGRQDLLERTLDSFLRYNTYPIREFIVVEDGDGAPNRALAAKYRQHPFKWLATGARVGQIAAIDTAYAAVKTGYIFHCEDDWEFVAPGFIEKSLAILKSNNEVLQVWIRAVDDTNAHPVLDYLFNAEEIPYRVPQCSGYCWHGFSFNPGLRRRREYDLLGSFGSLNPDGGRTSLQVEAALDEYYRQRGFIAAILGDDEGRGYVRHTGEGRHVKEPLPLRRGAQNNVAAAGHR